ncbi:MAG TPA: M81 family metallopeptidase [Vicinamibacterales bacterium]|nr:M81 family metallopeptidase [Vicinamibacterales bacterium]
MRHPHGAPRIVALLFLLAVAAWPRPAAARPAAGVRLAVASFSHETCTFCPDPTGVAEWEFYGPPQRGPAVLRGGGYVGGFVRAAREYEGVELVGILSPRDAKGGSSGSWITLEAFDKYANGIAEDIRRSGPFNGVYLALHGAMAVTGIPKPEAELVRRVRKVVGPAVPIFVTLDLHANDDHELSDAADGVLIIKRYPHYDAALQGERALRLMLRTIKGTFKPTMATRKPGVLTPSVFQGTGTSPSMEIMERARIWEERARDAYVSVAYGFAYADVPDVGATVMVLTNDDQALADRIADDMSAFIWRKREAFAGKTLPKTEEGVRLAIAAAKAGKTPVVIADHSDRTGNSTWILAELIKQGGRNFCITTISDERALSRLGSAKVGDAVRLDIGGWAEETSGQPVTIAGTLEWIGRHQQMDRVAVIRFGDNNRVILTPVLHQVTDPGIFQPLGIDLASVEIIVLKSRVHFWRGFVEDGLARAVFEVDAPGLGPADVTTIPYKFAPRTLYPLDRNARQQR